MDNRFCQALACGGGGKNMNKNIFRRFILPPRRPNILCLSRITRKELAVHGAGWCGSGGFVRMESCPDAHRGPSHGLPATVRHQVAKVRKGLERGNRGDIGWRRTAIRGIHGASLKLRAQKRLGVCAFRRQPPGCRMVSGFRIYFKRLLPEGSEHQASRAAFIFRHAPRRQHIPGASRRGNAPVRLLPLMLAARFAVAHP